MFNMDIVCWFFKKAGKRTLPAFINMYWIALLTYALHLELVPWSLPKTATGSQRNLIQPWGDFHLDTDV